MSSSTVPTTLRLVSFDIGLRTCSVAVEEYNFASFNKTIGSFARYVKHGEATADMKAFVQEVGLLGRIILLEKRDLGDKKAFFANHAFFNLYQWCKELNEQLQAADLILIEQQMKMNNIALSLMHHLQAYLLITYGSTKRVILYPSKNKTRVLGAPLKIVNKDQKLVKVTKYQRKKWSTECASDLLKRRNDTTWHSYIFERNKSKKDDLSDVLMQNLSYAVTHALSS